MLVEREAMQQRKLKFPLKRKKENRVDFSELSYHVRDSVVHYQEVMN